MDEVCLNSVNFRHSSISYTIVLILRVGWPGGVVVTPGVDGLVDDMSLGI